MNFQQKIKIDFQTGHYRVRTIASDSDLNRVLTLRQECFPALKSSNIQFDLDADHLIVEDIETGKLCGTYRITASNYANEFQTQEDFEIVDFLKTPEAKAELAWACIHPEYRNGATISLLWRGIVAYLKVIEAKYVFGTTSVAEMGPDRMARVQEALSESNCIYKTFPIKPVTPKAATAPVVSRDLTENKKSLRFLPALLRAYIVAGAFVCATPNFDIDLNCYDFMTIMDIDQSADQIASHFSK